jgi:hypothetical protein
MLNDVEQLVLKLKPSVRAARTFSDDQIRLIMSGGEEAHSWKILRSAYLQIIGKLRAAVSESGPLVCSWSA